MKLSDNLKIIRKENNLSQEQLAEKLGVSRQAVSKWESGQSYPEMDKVLLICKLFNYNIDELMNENIKEVSETKQSKININKYIEDFFEFITKTVDMLSTMKFKQKLKCFIEQIFIIIFLVCIFAIIGGVGTVVLSGLIGRLPNVIYYTIFNILESIYIVLGTIILLHIFKVRYLDYYEIIKENDINIDENENEEKIIEKSNANGGKRKLFIKKEKQKIIIRDPEHSQSKFLTGIMKIVLICIKIITVFVGIGFAISFIGLVTLLVLSFLFVKTGIMFVGGLFGIISALIINFVILQIIYNFIADKKNYKTRIAILLIGSLVLAGLSIGMILIGTTQFNIIEENNLEVEDTYNIQMTDNLTIGIPEPYIEYIENDSNEVKIVVNHSKYYKTTMENQNEVIYIFGNADNKDFMNKIRNLIKDINNKEIKNYNYDTKIKVYSSKSNIEKMKQNRQLQYEKSKNTEIEILNTENEELENKIEEQEIVIENQNEELNRKNNEIQILQNEINTNAKH